MTSLALAAVALAPMGCKDFEPKDGRATASAQRWATAESQLDMNAAAVADLDEIQAELTATLNDLRESASRSGVSAGAALALLEASQSAWESYVEAQIAMEWPKAEGVWQGSIAPMCVTLRRVALVQARVGELRTILEIEDDICGSRWP